MKNKCIEEYRQGLKEGRGSGRYDKYKPWIGVRNVKSCAVKSRVYSLRFNRLFHFFSHGEVLAFYQYEWDPNIVEIREQFPLDPAITYEICDGLNLLHPGYSRGGIVMTTDFVLTRRDFATGRESLSAVQIKYDQDDLKKPRTYSKLEIEHRYWQGQNVPWKIVLSRHLNPVFSTNLEFLYPLRNTPFEGKFLRSLLKAMRSFLGDDCLRIRDLARRGVMVGHKLMEVPQAINILCAKRLWEFDIRHKLLQECTLNDFKESPIC